MSNLLTNGNGSLPSFSSNTFIYYSSLTSIQRTNVYWGSTNSIYFALINGNNGFGYISLSGQWETQYASFQSGAALEQTVNISSRSNFNINIFIRI